MSDTTVAQWRPAPWFLLSPPQPKPGTVVRPRLYRLLDECTRSVPITLVQAPGGYGKSTVLADWSRQHAAPVAWLTASRGDDSPGRFAVGLLSALCRAADESDALVGFLNVLADPADLDLMLGRLLTVLNGLTAPLVVVVDDAHLLSADVASQVIMPLADHAPSARFYWAGARGCSSGSGRHWPPAPPNRSRPTSWR